MSDEKLDTIVESELNIEGVDNKPVCPICQGYLEDPQPGYGYRRHNPDTRWFWCGTCEGHLGYHRMKRRWRVDPFDLNSSSTFREHFNLSDE